MPMVAADLRLRSRTVKDWATEDLDRGVFRFEVRLGVDFMSDVLTDIPAAVNSTAQSSAVLTRSPDAATMPARRFPPVERAGRAW